MNPEISSLHERMARGGDWRSFQQDIARLNKEARTQEEYVTVLEAHRNLMAVAEECFPEDVVAEIQRIGDGEYKLFLNVEAMEGDLINPLMLDKITLREVLAGRLAPQSDFRNLAEAGGSVMGDSAARNYDGKLSNRIAIGGFILGAVAFFSIGKPLGVALFVAGMGGGWLINLKREKQARQVAQADRVARGYH